MLSDLPEGTPRYRYKEICVLVAQVACKPLQANSDEPDGDEKEREREGEYFRSPFVLIGFSTVSGNPAFVSSRRRRQFPMKTLTSLSSSPITNLTHYSNPRRLLITPSSLFMLTDFLPSIHHLLPYIHTYTLHANVRNWCVYLYRLGTLSLSLAEYHISNVKTLDFNP